MPTLDWDPSDLIHNLSVPAQGRDENTNVLKSLAEFFDVLAISLVNLTRRVSVEIITGEMADVLERIRYNALEHRLKKPNKPKGIDPTQFPRQYDRIHMSNIPYAGFSCPKFTHR